MKKIACKYLKLIFLSVFTCFMLFSVMNNMHKETKFKPGVESGSLEESSKVNQLENVSNSFNLKDGRISKTFLLYTTKIFKMWSYAFILYGVFLWMYNLSENDTDREYHKKWGSGVSIVTAVVFLFLFGQVIYFYSISNCPTETQGLNPLCFINEKYQYIADNFISLIPLIAIAIANLNLMPSTKDLSSNTCKNKPINLSFRRFFYIVYLPVLSAAMTILVLAIVIECFGGADSLDIMVSGSMAFLVFV